jgi:hypothetical protein
MPDAPQGLARTLIDWGESQQNKEAKIVDDPGDQAGLTDRLFDPTNPTTRQDLMKAQVAGKLSDHSFQSMERLVTELEKAPLKGPVWQATAAAVKDSLIVSVPGIPGKDTKGTQLCDLHAVVRSAISGEVARRHAAAERARHQRPEHR